MELNRTKDDLVSRLALVRAIRGQTHAGLGRNLGTEGEVVFGWEREGYLPSQAMVKRVAMALGWKWQDLLLPPLPHDEAWAMLLDARKAQAVGRKCAGC